MVYATPKAPASAFLFEPFDDIPAFEKRWVKSKAKKKDVDEDIAAYDGSYLTNFLSIIFPTKSIS